VPSDADAQSAASDARGVDHARRTTGASVVRGGAWEITGQVLPQVYIFVVSALVARTLGAAAYGRVALITGVQAAVWTIALWGFPHALTRYVSQLLGQGRDSELRGLLRWAYRVMVPMASLATAFMLGAVALGAQPTSAWALAAVSTTAGVLQAVPSAFLIGAQRWAQARAMGVAAGGASMIIKAVALSTGHGIVALFAIDVVIAIANLAGTAVLAARNQRAQPYREVEAPLKRDVFRFAAIIGISAAANLVVYQRTEIFVLAHYTTDTEIARYAIPYALVSALLLVPAAASTVLSPAIATLWGAGAVDRIRSGFGRALRLMVLLTIGLAAISAAVAPALVRVVYGIGHEQWVIWVLLLSVPFVPLGTMSTSLLRAMGLLRWLTVSGILAAVLNIVLSFVLIPPFGAVGAAAANTSAQAAAAVPLLVYAIWRLGEVPLPVQQTVRGLLAGGGAAVLSYVVTRPLPPAAGLGAGLVTFGLAAVALSVALGVPDRDDRTWLAATLSEAARFRRSRA
jgi:O-antigen/teichoic acid export membrane protein